MHATLRDFGVVPRRWFIIFAYGLSSICSFAIMSTFPPVQSEAMKYFGVTEEEVDHTSLLFLIVSLPFLLLTLRLLRQRGSLRSLTLSSICLSSGGALIRYLGVVGHTHNWTAVMIGQLVSAVGQPLILATPATLAALWFHPSESALATTLGSVLGYLGIAISFLAGHIFADSPAGISNLLLFHFVFSVICLIVVFIAFVPNRGMPIRPPHIAALRAERHEIPLFDIFRSALSNSNIWFLIIGFGLSGGAFVATFILLSQILRPEGYSQAVVSYAGFSLFLSCVFFSLLISPFVDRLGKYKPFLIGANCFQALFFLVFNLSSETSSVTYIYVSVIGFGIGGAVYPLSLDAAAMYADTGFTSVVLVMSQNFFGIIFLIIMNGLEDFSTGRMRAALWFAMIVEVLCIVFYALFQDPVQCHSSSDVSTHPFIEENDASSMGSKGRHSAQSAPDILVSTAGTSFENSFRIGV